MMIFIGLLSLANASTPPSATENAMKNDWQDAYNNATDHWCNHVQIQSGKWNGKSTCQKVLKMYNNLKQCNDTGDLSDTNIVFDKSDFDLYQEENGTDQDSNDWIYDDTNTGTNGSAFQLKTFVTFYSNQTAADVDRASADIAKHCYQRCEGAVVLGWAESQCDLAKAAYASFKDCDGKVNKASFQKWFSQNGAHMNLMDASIGLPSDMKFDQYVTFGAFMLSQTDTEGNNDADVSFEEFVKPFAGLRGTTYWSKKLLQYFKDQPLDNGDCSAPEATEQPSGVNTLVASTFMGLAFLL